MTELADDGRWTLMIGGVAQIGRISENGSDYYDGGRTTIHCCCRSCILQRYLLRDSRRASSLNRRMDRTGWQLGSSPEIQVATVVSNHLTAGVMKYFGDSFRFGPAVNLFEKLAVREGEVACLLAQSYFGMSKSSISCNEEL